MELFGTSPKFEESYPRLSNEMSVPEVGFIGGDSARVPLMDKSPRSVYELVVQRIFSSLQKAGISCLFAADLLFEEGFPVALKIYSASAEKEENDIIAGVIHKSFGRLLAAGGEGQFDDFRISFFYHSFSSDSSYNVL